MIVGELMAFREEAGLSQTQMAKAMHLSLRAYQEIESLTLLNSVSERHRMLAERASLSIAVARGKVDLALPSIRREAMDLVAIFRGERTSART